jgi:hypothetical protein
MCLSINCVPNSGYSTTSRSGRLDSTQKHHGVYVLSSYLHRTLQKVERADVVERVVCAGGVQPRTDAGYPSTFGEVK